MKSLLIALAIVVLLTGCSVVSYNRVFPKLTWYWQWEAVAERTSNKESAQHEAAAKARSIWVLIDTVENDYWTGTAHRWDTKEKALRMTYAEAEKQAKQMRENEEGGYANVRDTEWVIQILKVE